MTRLFYHFILKTCQMLELPHTLIGAAIATKIPNPVFALPLALISHVLVDLIPHWNPSLYTETKKHGRPTRKSNRIILIDVLLSLAAGFLIAARVWPDLSHFLVIIFACFFAVLPDLVEAPYFYLNYRPKILKKLILWQHHHQGRAKPIPGLLIQILTIILTLTFILVN